MKLVFGIVSITACGMFACSSPRESSSEPVTTRRGDPIVNGNTLLEQTANESPVVSIRACEKPSTNPNDPQDCQEGSGILLKPPPGSAVKGSVVLTAQHVVQGLVEVPGNPSIDTSQ